MATKVVKLNDFSRELEKFTDKTAAEIRVGVIAGVQKSIPDLVAASPVDTGLYASSWNMTETETSVILGNSAPHAGIIEEGARPFSPPIAPLLAWAKRVLGDSSQPPEYSPAVRKLAYAVRAKIQHEGMKPRHILQDMLPTIVANIRSELLGK